MNVRLVNMKKRLLLYATILLASCTMFSCSEDEDPDWIITKYIVQKYGDNDIRSWRDTIYNKPEEYIIAEVELFESKSNNSHRYIAEYRKF